MDQGFASQRTFSSPHRDPVSTVDLYERLPVIGTDRQIRLLELMPGSWDESLKGRLSVRPLDHGYYPEGYTALSYVWGPGSIRQISVNDVSLNITDNLYTALRYLRSEHQPRKFWVDSICIHQSNNKEKEMQVAQMSAVYEKATNVIAWLGESTSDSELVMDHLRLGTAHHQEDQREMFRSFWELPYWTRVWVVQEMAFANRLIFQWGGQMVDFQKVEAYRMAAKQEIIRSADRADGGSRVMRQSPFWKFYNCLNLVAIHAPWSPTPPRSDTFNDVLRLLKDAAHLKATQDVDKIYGLLQLFPNTFKDSLPLEYGMEFPTLSRKLLEVYRHQFDNLNLLCEFQPLWYDSKFQGCSSWAVDVRTEWEDTGMVRNNSYWDKEGKARAPQVIFSGTSLHARGAVLSRVDRIVKPFGSARDVLSPDFKYYQQLLAEITGSALAKLGTRLSVRDPEHMFLKLLAGKMWEQQRSEWCPYSCWEVWNNMTYTSDPTVLWEYGKAFEFLFVRLHKRCFFTTTDGYIGLGPPHLREGDQVCAVYGCRMLLALREQVADASSEPSYQFVGPVCVDDLAENIDCLNGEYERVCFQII